jgi:hypothetical protein
MSIIVYASNPKEFKAEFLFAEDFLRFGLENFEELDSLIARLGKPRRKINAAILYLSQKEDLSRIVEVRDLLSDIRTIVVAPDRDADTVAKAHLLRPRFLSYLDNDPETIQKVAEKMLL